MKAKFLFLSISLILIESCTSISEKEIIYNDDDIQIINTDNAKDITGSTLSDIVSDYDYIPLETTNESLIGNVRKLLVHDQYVFIQDRLTQAILIFDNRGSFINKIEKGGNGPGEYSELVSFTIDTEQDKLILGTMGKLMFFDFQGNFIYEYKTILGGAFQISYSGNGKLAMYTNYTLFDEDQGFYQLLIFDLNREELVSRSIPFNKAIIPENLTSLALNFSITSDKGTSLSIPYKNYVWSINDNDISPTYTIDFGSNKLPDNYEDEYLTDPKHNSQSLRMLEQERNWNRIRGAGVIINDDLVNFSYSDKGEFTELYFDRITKKAIKFKVPLINDIDGSKHVVQLTSRQNEFISLVNASDIVLGYKEGRIRDSRIQELAKSLEIDSNPVLRVLKIKEIGNVKE